MRQGLPDVLVGVSFIDVTYHEDFTALLTALAHEKVEYLMIVLARSAKTEDPEGMSCDFWVGPERANRERLTKALSELTLNSLPEPEGYVQRSIGSVVFSFKASAFGVSFAEAYQMREGIDLSDDLSISILDLRTLHARSRELSREPKRSLGSRHE